MSSFRAFGGNFQISESGGGYVCEFTDYNGVTKRIMGYSPENVEAKVLKHIEKYGLFKGYSSRGTYKSRVRTEGSRWGRKTNVQKQLEAILGEVEAKSVMASTAGIAVANIKITNDVARRLLKNTYKSRGNFNTYTGNLERAYKATIVRARNIVDTVYLDKTPKGNEVVSSERLGRNIVWLYKQRHPLGTIRQNSYRRWKKKRAGRLANDRYKRQPYRYFKTWENKSGYRSRGIASAGRTRMSGFGYFTQGKTARVQSGILIENSAPYAAAVTAAGYPVIPGGMATLYRSRGMHYGEARGISVKMLKAAKLI